MDQSYPTGTAFRMVDATEAKADGLRVWSPLLVPREAIEAEVERLAAGPLPASGRRAALIVHPMSTAPGLGISPGVDVTVSVLRPGEATVPARRNSNQVEFCIRGRGTVLADGQEIAVAKWGVWNMPSMRVHGYRNNGDDLFVRLSYSNAPLLEKLGTHFMEEGDAIRSSEAGAGRGPAAPSAYRRDTAPDFPVTEAGARLRGYEFLTDIEVVDNQVNYWPWEAVEPHLPAVPGDNKRGILLLYNPATERRNGTTHSFFATLSQSAPGSAPRPPGRGHRHSSVAINYHFKGAGSSVVDGQEFHWRAGDLMLSAPSWSEHAHYPGPEGHAILTVQDHPQQIGMESLIWQERIPGSILTLGSEAGQTGFVGPRQAGA